MWHLQHIKAFNICAFKELDYWFHEKRTTLIFGNNQDNDSQGSNGSGKSALLEAIAISLTGETLRKVKMEEIINDSADDAGIYMTLWNDSTGTTMDIARFLSRKSAQEIHVDLTNIANSEHQKITQPSVAEYNKYILETLGLSKDDIFTNFILSKHKYTSFLSSSDKDKKELINRFSNGVMVDESITALQADMEPVQEALKEAQDKVNFCSGQVTALDAQIAQTEEKSLQNGRSKQERIEKIREEIAAKRESIRQQNIIIDEADNKLDLIDVFDAKRVELEENYDLAVQDIYKALAKEANILTKKGVGGFSEFTDYTETVKGYQNDVKELNKKHKEVEKSLTQLQRMSEHLATTHTKLEERFNKFSNELAGKDKKLTDKLEKFKDSIIHLQLNNRKLTEQRSNLTKDIANLNNLIAGVIECPKCHHEFLLQSDVDIDETRTQIKEREYEIADIDKCISNNDDEISQIDENSRSITLKHQDLQKENMEWSKKITESQLEIDRVSRELGAVKNDLEQCNSQILKIQRNIDEAGEKMLDEFYNMDVAATESYNKIIDGAKEIIKIDEGTIKSLEDSIEAIQNTSESDLIDSMKNTLVEYQANLAKAEKKEYEIQGQLNNMKAQETNFVEFKSYLANQKIDALSQMTNEFLEAIGSDIRIVFSGFTVLKSGKIREKISISLVRDGVDCGSFGKFSEGEKARVNLANILAMHKLTNLNCDDDKGLDILILDEILEATDEQGLSNIFTALNKLELTALVVSHGNIAENYPYKTVVTKLNGISTIND